jgi:cellulose synthase/poly-beta-1,6-N-acetylglucosamine synthase-like glycosyltransferase
VRKRPLPPHKSPMVRVPKNLLGIFKILQMEWSFMKVLVCVNMLTEIDSQVYPSHLTHAFRMGRDTDYEVMLFTPRRMAIAAARNMAAKEALKNNCDWLFFYDDDMELHPQTLKTLISRDKDIIMGLCCIRGYPFRKMVFKWVEKDDELSSIADLKVKGKLMTFWEDCDKFANEQGVIETGVAAVGCACTLIRTEIFKYLEDPYFYTGTQNTEDTYFCLKAYNAIENLKIAVDTTVPAGHILKDKDILYPETAEFLRKKVIDHDEYVREKIAHTEKQKV